MDIKIIIKIISFVIAVVASMLIFKGKEYTLKRWIAEVLVFLAIDIVLWLVLVVALSFFY